jgi:ATP-dependent DNA ligase
MRRRRGDCGDLVRYQRHNADAVLVAFDLIELDGEDLRRMPIERRKDKLLRLVHDQHPGIVFNGEIVFKNALSLRPCRALAQDQEPGRASSKT